MANFRAGCAEAARLVRWPLSRLRRGALQNLDTLEIFLGGFGLVAALLVAALVSPALGALPGAAGDFAPIAMAILLAPVGISVALGRRTEIERFVRSIGERTGALATPARDDRRAAPPTHAILDTSAIIDGRLADLVASGFLLADLIVPRFILEELRRVADSSDPLKRQRGRRGMELLAKIQADERVRTTIDEERFADESDVDARLVALARARGAALLTTDYNLARVAGLEQIRVLNLNSLAQAVRTNVLPGEPLHLTIHEQGRERRQGVGYLEDGTMVVVEEAQARLGDAVEVEVTRVIQTAAGRMVFARLAGPDHDDPAATEATEVTSEAGGEASE